MILGVILSLALVAGMGMLAVHYSTRKPSKDAPKPAKSKFQTPNARRIWNRYLELPESMQTFPELFDALLLAEEEGVAKYGLTPYFEDKVSIQIYTQNSLPATVNRLRCQNPHHHSYRMMAEFSRYYGTTVKYEMPCYDMCHACNHFDEFSDAVNGLHREAALNIKAEEEWKKNMTLKEIENRKAAYEDLTERMRQEVQIRSEARKELI